MEQNEIRSAIEAILIASPEPVSPSELSSSLEIEQGEVDTHLEEIGRSVEQSVGGFMLERVAGGVRIATRPEYDEQLRRFFSRKKESRMSIAALETLAIVAYRQPITGPEVSDLRGVNSSGVLRTLLERRMIRIAGRKNVVGSPFLYRTTKDFLLHFGLERIQDLPKLEEFGEILGEQVADDLGLGDIAEEVLDAQDENEAREPEDAQELNDNGALPDESAPEQDGQEREDDLSKDSSEESNDSESDDLTEDSELASGEVTDINEIETPEPMSEER